MIPLNQNFSFSTRSNRFRVIKFLIFFIVFSVITTFFCKRTSEIKEIFSATQIIFLPQILIIAVTATLFQAILWAYFMIRIGCGLSYWKIIGIWLFSLIGTYVPGSIWLAVSRIYLLQQANFSIKKSVYSILFEQILNLASAMFVVLITPDLLQFLRIPFSFGLALAALMLIVLFPNIWGKLIWRLGFKRIDFRLIPKVPLISITIFFFGLVGLYYIRGILVLLTLQFFNLHAVSMPLQTASGIPAASFVTGYLAVFAPSGFGVKEGTYAILLSQKIPLTEAVLCALSMRLWLILCHLIVIPTGYLYLKRTTPWLTHGRKV